MLLKLNKKIDARGTLLPLEIIEIPFTVLRCFFLTDIPLNTTRGDHAHHKTEQFLFCVYGQVTVTLNNGAKKSIYNLKAGEGVLIPKKVWNSFFVTKLNTVLAVLASTIYDENDYINCYNEFISLLNSK